MSLGLSDMDLPHGVHSHSDSGRVGTISVGKNDIGTTERQAGLTPSHHPETHAAPPAHAAPETHTAPQAPAHTESGQSVVPNFSEETPKAPMKYNAAGPIAFVGGLNALNSGLNGDTVGVVDGSLQTIIGVTTQSLKLAPGPAGAAASGLSGLADGYREYKHSHDMNKVVKAGGKGAIKTGLQIGATSVLPTVAGGTTTYAMSTGLFGEAAVAAAPEAGAIVTALTGTALTTGGLILGTAAGGYAVGTAIERHYHIADRSTNELYKDTYDTVSKGVQTTGMKHVDKNGLPIIDATQNKELADLINKAPDANKLSSDPLLAARGITNAHDPKFIAGVVEKAQRDAKNTEAQTHTGAFFQLIRLADSREKLIAVDKAHAAQVQAATYEVKFNKWDKSPNGTHPSESHINSKDIHAKMAPHKEAIKDFKKHCGPGAVAQNCDADHKVTADSITNPLRPSEGLVKS